MKNHIKFENLETELYDLPEVFKNSLQNEVLDIKKLNKTCEKFKKIAKMSCDLEDAEYVLFSKFMGKEFHNLETFIFIDHTGKVVCDMSGREIDLYNMLMECDNLIEAKVYD